MKAANDDKKYPLAFELIIVPFNSGLCAHRIERVKARETNTLYITWNGYTETRYKKLTQPTTKGLVAVVGGSGGNADDQTGLYLINSPFPLETRALFKKIKLSMQVSDVVAKLARKNPEHDVFSEIDELLRKHNITNI